MLLVLRVRCIFAARNQQCQADSCLRLTFSSYQILDKTKAPVSKDRLASVHVLYYLRFSLACQQLSVVVFVQASLLALAQILVA